MESAEAFVPDFWRLGAEVKVTKAQCLGGLLSQR